MIYTMYDYLSKYSDTLSEIIALAEKDNYSFDYIEKTISYSIPFFNFENSNITDIAFSSCVFSNIIILFSPSNNL